MLMSISLSIPSVDDMASIRLGEARRKTPFPGVDREEIRRPAVWQTTSSWTCVLRIRRLRNRDGPLTASTASSTSSGAQMGAASH
jgi:hypothetical protein